MLWCLVLVHHIVYVHHSIPAHQEIKINDMADMPLISNIDISDLRIGYFIVVIMYTIFQINLNIDNILVIIAPGM